jgi:PAS domain S-box-containing protein
MTSSGHSGRTASGPEARLRAILDKAYEFIGLLSPDGHVLEANAAALEFIGATREQVIGRDFRDTAWWSWSPRQRAALDTAIHRAAENHFVRMEAEHRSAEGRIEAIDFSLSPVTGDSGRVTCLVAEGRRITAHKRLEARLHEMVERFELVMRGANDGIWDWHLREGWAYFSPRFCELLGYRADEVPPVAQTWDGLPHSEDRERASQVLREHFEKRKPYHLEMRLRTGTGAYRWFSVRGQAVWDDGGVPIRMAGSIRDITERKEIERELEKRSAQLVLARDEAERANRAKSRFLAAASHDLRQPLQTLSVLHAILSRTVSEAEAQPHLRSLGEAIHNMENLLGALLDINRLETGAIAPQVCAFPLEQIFSRLKADLAYAAEHKGLALDFEPSAHGVRSDPHLLEVILRNLVSNAIKYTARGSVRVCTRADGDGLRICVVDTGIGIADEHLERIFEEFYQVDNPQRDQRRGVGLGLTIVQRLSALLGHAVTVESKHGAGSTFTIRVPAANEGLRATVGDGKAYETVGGSGKLGKPVTVLHIEDDADVARSIGMVLRLEGYRVIPAATEEEALRVVQSDSMQPDLILTDHQLPGGVFGHEVVQRLAAILGKRPPTIMLTGDISDQRRAVVSNAVDRVLEKPVDVDALLRELAALRGNRGREN